MNSHSPSATSWAVIALGANLGSPERTLRSAIQELEKVVPVPLLQSSFWRTSPVDCPPGSPDFINAVVAFEVPSALTPETLLARLHEIEDRLGRQRSGALNEARTLDLDLIAFGDESRSGGTLLLPHPRAHERRFVLAPLAEILPNFQAPGWPTTAALLLQKLSSTGVVEPLA